VVLTACVSAAVMVALPIAAAATVTWSTSFNPPKRSGYEVGGFAARSAVDVWAVGLRPGGRCQFQTLTQHWDGSTWKAIASPSDTTVNSVLDGVTVAAKKQAWAVGTVGCPADQSRTLTEHWNDSGWSIVPSPNGGVKGNHFSTPQAVTAISGRDVWAVGSQAGTRHQVPVTVPLIEHWNGASWSIVHLQASAPRQLTVMIVLHADTKPASAPSHVRQPASPGHAAAHDRPDERESHADRPGPLVQV